MNYRFSSGARIDLLAAAEYYESRRTGLGLEFTDAVDQALSAVLEAPQRWPELEPGIRRFRLGRFPYALIYQITSEHALVIIAVFDLRRRPGSWRRSDN